LAFFQASDIEWHQIQSLSTLHHIIVAVVKLAANRHTQAYPNIAKESEAKVVASTLASPAVTLISRDCRAAAPSVTSDDNSDSSAGAV